MRKIGLVLAILALVALPAMAQDMNIMGAGARAHGMGGAFIAIADDATAISWNPAGIANLDRPEASAVGLFNMKTFKNEWSYNDPTIPYDTAGTAENSVSHIAPNFFSLAVPFKAADRNLVIAVAYNRMIDFGEAKSEDTLIGGIKYESSYKQTGGIDAISPAIAFQLTPKVSLGLTANIIVNGSTYTEEESGTDGYNYEYEETMDFSGFNMHMGMLAQVNKQLSLGLAYRMPFELTRESSWEWSETIPGIGTTTGDGEDLYEQTWTMPWMLGVGLAFRPSENMTLAFDYERRNFSSTEYTYGPSPSVEMGWNNVNQFRVGMEYLFVGPNAVFPIRLGFRTNPQVEYAIQRFTDASWIDTDDSTGMNGMVFTGGFGMKFGNIWLDLAAEYGITTVYSYEHTYWDNTIYKDETKENSLNLLASCIVHF
ncbi:outer membrane protein transport protein [candidate division TA06 bacterium]|nr:outer membrane protein transport protein [candidate division TA06 bacterium]